MGLLEGSIIGRYGRCLPRAVMLAWLGQVEFAWRVGQSDIGWPDVGEACQPMGGCIYEREVIFLAGGVVWGQWAHALGNA